MVPDIHAAHAALFAAGVAFIQPPQLVARMEDQELGWPSSATQTAIPSR